MADIPISEIGLGVAGAYIIIRETFGFVKNIKGNTGKNGECVKRHEFSDELTKLQTTRECDQIVKRLEQRADDRHKVVLDNLGEIKTLIKNGNNNQ
jgi:hypothetical protein